jgi:Na+/alanine symporter
MPATSSTWDSGARDNSGYPQLFTATNSATKLKTSGAWTTSNAINQPFGRMSYSVNFALVLTAIPSPLSMTLIMQRIPRYMYTVSMERHGDFSAKTNFPTLKIILYSPKVTTCAVQDRHLQLTVAEKSIFPCVLLKPPHQQLPPDAASIMARLS